MEPSPQTSRTPSETSPLQTAKEILATALQEGQRTLFIFDIPIRAEETPAKPGKIRPYLTTCYNRDDLGNINVIAYIPELLSDAKKLSPHDFFHRARTGIKEEAIHGIQILSVKLRYSRLPKEKQKEFKNAGAYYEALQQNLFLDLCKTPKSRKLLLAAGRLYYGDPKIQSVAQLHDADIKNHGRIGYITIELVRQILQARLGDHLSEEARVAALDKHGAFTHLKEEIKALSQTIRSHAAEPEKVSPMMAEIIRETEALLSPEPPTKTRNTNTHNKKPEPELSL